MKLLTVKDLTFAYPRQEPVFKKINFEVKAGEILSLLGPNGAGKSTLLKCLLGLNKYRGEITLNGKKLSQLSRKEIAKKIAFVPQTYQVNSEISVLAYLLTGRTPYLNLFQSPKQSDYQEVKKLLADFKLENLANKAITNLSGGQLQLITILKALVQKPELLILDEPMAALDLKRQKELIKLIKKLSQNQVAIILTTHQPNYVFMLEQKVALMGKDYYFKTGLTDELLSAENLSQIYQTEVSVSYLPDLKRKNCQIIL